MMLVFMRRAMAQDVAGLHPSIQSCISQSRFEQRQALAHLIGSCLARAMTHANSLQDTIFASERKVWDALIAGDAAADDALLAADFLGVYPDGFAGKADHVGQLLYGPTIQHYAISDPRYVFLTEDTVALSYRADFMRISRKIPEAMYVTSIWQSRGSAGWVNIFSQDTPT